MNWSRMLAAGLFLMPVAVGVNPAHAQKKAEKKPPKAMSQEAKRGKYLVEIGSCNDCHTPGFVMSGGKVHEQNWLIGDTLGWRGSWGTTYPANLRLVAQNMTAAQWMARAQRIASADALAGLACDDGC